MCYLTTFPKQMIQMILKSTVSRKRSMTEWDYGHTEIADVCFMIMMKLYRECSPEEGALSLKHACIYETLWIVVERKREKSASYLRNCSKTNKYFINNWLVLLVSLFWKGGSWFGIQTAGVVSPSTRHGQPTVSGCNMIWWSVNTNKSNSSILLYCHSQFRSGHYFWSMWKDCAVGWLIW